MTIVDAAGALMTGASRWNEGKIHLGYLYAADPSLATARRLLPGGLAFRPLMEDLLGQSIAPAVADHDETYLVHRRSVAGVDATANYFDRVADMVGEAADHRAYLSAGAARRPVRLSAAALAQITDSEELLAGFSVPERSVSTTWIADRLADAVAAEPRIRPRLGVRVDGVRRHADGRFGLLIHADEDGRYDAVVNALWHGRIAVDRSLGLPLPVEFTHRYRVSAFVRTSAPIEVPSLVIGTGPFGDVKRYGDREAYLSWYESGLLVESTQVEPPSPPEMTPDREARVSREIVERLGQYVPSVRGIGPTLTSVRVRGGWVYASGRGPLSDAASTLHRRDRVGATADGRYVSVDTGKYSIAPWLAVQVAGQMVP